MPECTVMALASDSHLTSQALPPTTTRQPSNFRRFGIVGATHRETVLG